MAAITQQHHIDAAPRFVYDTVVDYESYPSFFPEFKEALILDTDGQAKIVEFTADYGKTMVYTLRIEHDEELLKTSWTYVGGDLKNSVGGWSFSDDGKGGTNIEYHVLVEVGFLVPKMISDRLIARNIPAMFEQLEKEVVRRQS